MRPRSRRYPARPVGGGAVVLEEGGVGVDVAAEAFAQNELGAGELKRGMEVGSASSLDAMVGPQGLRAVAEFDLLKGLFAGMCRGEGVVVGSVPVLGEDDVLEMLGGAMDGLDDGVAIGNGERATGAEVVLHVDDEKDVVWSDLHWSEMNNRGSFGFASG